MNETDVRFSSLDGLVLKGTLQLPTGNVRQMAVLVHGITTDREEDGFYTELANRLQRKGIGSLRFDFRGHGKSEGTYQGVTLSGVMNDIGAAIQQTRREPTGRDLGIILIGASFGGGLSAFWCSEHTDAISKLVLFNPLLDYAQRMLFSKPFWDGVELTNEGAKELNRKGWLPHGEFRMGRSLINELLYIRPFEKTASIKCPILTLHGDRDSSVPIEVARRYLLPNDRCSFVPIEGADHGFTSPGDEEGSSPDSTRFQNLVLQKVVDWVG